eukprot:768673-Hanusia_phi.AAC.8
MVRWAARGWEGGREGRGGRGGRGGSDMQVIKIRRRMCIRCEQRLKGCKEGGAWLFRWLREGGGGRSD